MKFAGLTIGVLLGGITALAVQFSPPVEQETYTKHEAFGIFRPVDDGTGLTKWEFVQDASHYGPLFLGEPYIEGNSVKADFNEQVSIFSGQLTHDGQLASFPPGLSINTTGISFFIWEMRKPVLLFQIRLNDGHVTSWTETPTGSTNFETIVTTQNGNEFELFFVDHEYINAPFVTEAPEGYTVKTVYPGRALHPHVVRLKVFDSAGSPVSTHDRGSEKGIETREKCRPWNGGKVVAYTECNGREGKRKDGKPTGQAGLCNGTGRNEKQSLRESKNQWEIEPTVGRVVNGISHRVDRLRGLGNAVIPQIAQWIGERIMDCEECQIQLVVN